MSRPSLTDDLVLDPPPPCVVGPAVDFVDPGARSERERDEALRDCDPPSARSSDGLDDVAPRSIWARGVVVLLLLVAMVALTVFGLVRALP